MVSRNHNRADSGPPGIRYGLFRFHPRRIHHGYQPQKGKTVLCFQGQHMAVLHFFISKCQNTQTIPGKFHILTVNFLPVCLRKLPDSLGGTDMGCPV